MSDNVVKGPYQWVFGLSYYPALSQFSDCLANDADSGNTFEGDALHLDVADVRKRHPGTDVGLSLIHI